MRRTSTVGIAALLCVTLGLTSTAGADTAGSAPAGSSQQSDAGVFNPITPTRAVDTRTSGKPAAGAIYTADLTGVGVPVNATAVSLNVTVTDPAGDGYITLSPAGAGMPLVSNLNYVAGETTANAAIVAVAAGKVDFLTSAPAHVLFDVSGYWTPVSGPVAAGRFQPISSPTRVLDTRDSGARVGPAGQTVSLAGAAVPSDAHAVAVTLTATDGLDAGYVTAWGEGDVPFVSNVNFGAGQTIANMAIVPVSNGSITVLASSPAHLIVDVSGWFTGYIAQAARYGQFVAATPSRVLDTRDGTGRLTPPDTVNCDSFVSWEEANEVFWTYVNAGLGDPYGLDRTNNPDNDPCETLPGHPGGARPIVPANARVPRRGTIPAANPHASAASALAVNITVAAPEAAGFVTAYPAGGTLPLASNVNPAYPGHIRPGLALVGTGASNRIWLYTSGSAHLIADAAGWFTLV